MLYADDKTDLVEEASVPPAPMPASISLALPVRRADISAALIQTGPDIARWLRTYAHFERQRKISQSNVDRLAEEMSADRFIPGTQIYVAVLPDGTLLVLNGNHTLEAICASGKTILICFVFKRVADLDAAGRLYAVFDIHKARSWLDSLRATGQENDVPNAPAVLAAVGVMLNDFAQASTYVTGSRLRRFELMEEYGASAELLNRAISGAPNSALVRRAAVMAIALETVRYQPSAATEFWYRFAHDEGLTTGMPERALLSWLRNAPKYSSQAARRETARAAALAWNAFFAGRSLEYCKPNAMGKFVLLGTPWAHGVRQAKRS